MGFNTNMQLAWLLPLTHLTLSLATNQILQNSTFFSFFFGDPTSELTAFDIHTEETQDTNVNLETTTFLHSHVETFDVHCKLEFRECWFRDFEKNTYPSITAEQSYNVASNGEGGQGRFSWPRFRSGQSHNCRVWGRECGKQCRSSTYCC